MARRRYKHLTKEQQLEVFQENLGLAGYISKRYKCLEDVYEDKLQEGLLGLWEGVLNLDKYDPCKGELSTFLGWYVQNRLGNFTWKASNHSGLSAGVDAMKDIRKQGETESGKAVLNTQAVSLEAPVKEHEDTTYMDFIGGAFDEYDYGFTEEIDKLLDNLDDNKREMLVRNFGIGCEPESRREIGKQLGVCGQNVDYHIHKAIDQIRETPGTSSLMFYLEA